MNRKLRRFAPLGLYLALLAVLVSSGLFIVQREWNLYLQISLACIIVGLAIFAVLDPEKVRTALTGRQARYGSNALVMTLAFFGIVLVANFLAYKNPYRWDLTENKQNTLAKETLDTLKALPQPVQALAFYPPTASTETTKNLLDNYKFYAKGKFDYKFIDPIKDPVTAKSVNVPLETGGTIVLLMADREEKVTSATEEEMTGALVRLLAQKVAVYFLTGHDEYSPDETGDQGYSKAKDTLSKKNYTVQNLNLLATNKIPDDAKVIVIAGPRKPLSDNEVKLLTDYQAKGGALIVMEDSTLLTDFGASPDPLAAYLTTAWSIVLGNDIVIDTTSQQPYQPFAYEYSTSHPITDKLQRIGTAFPTARSVSALGNLPDVTDNVLIRTAPQSWAETNLTDLQNGGQPSPDQGADIIGSVPLAVAGERTGGYGRVVVVGDADFAINVNFAFLGNGDLLINSVDWASNQESLINLTPKESVTRSIIQPKRVTIILIGLGTVGFLPAVVIVAGIAVWYTRRKRG